LFLKLIESVRSKLSFDKFEAAKFKFLPGRNAEKRMDLLLMYTYKYQVFDRLPTPNSIPNIIVEKITI